jgi:hypothetical protein
VAFEARVWKALRRLASAPGKLEEVREGMAVVMVIEDADVRC